MYLFSPHPNAPWRWHCCPGWQWVCHLWWSARVLSGVCWDTAAFWVCTIPSLLSCSCSAPLCGTLRKKMKVFYLCCMSFTENFVELNRAQLLCLNRLPDRMTTDNTSCVKGWDTMGSLIIVAVNKTLPLWLSFARCRPPGRLQTNKKVTSLWHNKEKWIVMENERSRQKCKYTTFPNWSTWTWTWYIAEVFHLRICRITTMDSVINWPDMVSIHWLIGGV